MTSDLATERKNASFPVRKMTYLLGRGEAITHRKEYIRDLVQSDPILRNENKYFQSRKERYNHGIHMVYRLQQIAKENNLLSEEDHFFMLDSINDLLPTNMHDGIFIGCIEGQGTPEQVGYWIPLAKKKAILGAYAQTELGHGSNVQGLETTATFIKETDEFEIHSPTVTSMKYWPGCLGKTATHVVAFARLIINTKDYGIHPFIIQIRSLENHQPLPGITVGDIGPKFGTEANDNGYLLFNHVRIPRNQLLMRFAQVSSDGTYTKPPHQKMAYGSMVRVRSIIVLQASKFMGMALTIAIRYSCIRRQFGKPGQPEFQILDYTTQQYRLLPYLASSYALRFTGLYIVNLYNTLLSKLSSGNTSLLAETHALTSGLKSFVTQLTIEAIEECRKCCGGHGVSRFSGLPDLFTNYIPFQIAEGDNILLAQQAARFLLKSIQATVSGQPQSGSVNYLENHNRYAKETCSATTIKDFLTPDVQLHAMTHRSLRLIVKVFEQFQTLLGEGNTFENAWNILAVELCYISKVHCIRTILNTFIITLQDQVKNSYPELFPILKKLLDLFALYWIERDIGDFYEDGYLTSTQGDLVRQAVRMLLKEIRKEAVPLVDAFGFTDIDLHSALGRYDGKVYETLYEWALKEPLNQTEIVQPTYDLYLRPLLKGQLPQSKI